MAKCCLARDGRDGWPNTGHCGTVEHADANGSGARREEARRRRDPGAPVKLDRRRTPQPRLKAGMNSQPVEAAKKKELRPVRPMKDRFGPCGILANTDGK
jgi:hypothetical protein